MRPGAHDLTFGSLFAGVGGFDLGFEQAGWSCRWQVEWDLKCRGVLARHWPAVARYEDVRDVHDPEPVDLITYGFPCQDLSVAGRRAGLDGDRSGLFFEATRLIKEMRDATDGRYPTWAVAENVPGLLNADRGAAMGRCLDELAAIGAVDIQWGVVDAQYLGLAQRRKRVFIVACFDPGAAGGREIFALGEGVFGDSGESGTARTDVAGGAAAGAGASGAAGCTATARCLTAETGHRNNGTEQNFVILARAEAPAPTLNQFDNGDSRATVLAPAQTGVRRLTPRECERLQGFPDDWTRWDADGHEQADTNRYRQMGNAVAVPVARWVAERIIGSRDAG